MKSDEPKHRRSKPMGQLSGEFTRQFVRFVWCEYVEYAEHDERPVFQSTDPTFTHLKCVQ